MDVSGADRLNTLHEYFFSEKRKQIQQLESEGTDIINLGMGNPDLPPHPKVLEALKRSAQQESNHGYQSYRGIETLREAMADWMNSQFKLSVQSEDEILPLMGSKEGIFHISMAFLNPGDIVAIPELGYPPYESISRMVGARVVRYPLDKDYQPDWNSMNKEVEEAKILWMNYPNMPTGVLPRDDTFSQAIEYGIKTNTLICHDNPYCQLLNPEPKSIFQTPGAEGIAIELHSLSKSHNMAGWRVGWIAGKKDFIDMILKIKSNIDSGMFRAIQDAAIEALKLNFEWTESLNTIYASRQQFAFRLLEILGCTYNPVQSGLFVWGQLPDNQNSVEVTDMLLKEKGIFITPGFIFGEKGKNYIRIALCVPEIKMNEALRRLSE